MVEPLRATPTAMTPQLDRATAERPRQVVLLGATGSIGTQALDVIAGARQLTRPVTDAEHPPFEIAGVAAGTGNLERLARHAVTERAAVVATSGDDDAARELREQLTAISAHLGVRDYHPEVLHGPRAAVELAAHADADLVLNGITGSIGLEPTLAALEARTPVALANKESLIAGGPLVLDAATRSGLPDPLIPVDSEHSAIAQALRGGAREELDRLVLTASGGPFRGYSAAQLAAVTPHQALQHPTWDMGLMVTTNSATMVNKALEVLEASLLFDVALERIDVSVHPQSVVHSMVQFVDGSTLAQVSPPDMRLPIALGLGWPHRVTAAASACDWRAAQHWTFEALDENVFPAIALMKRAGARGGTWPAVYNAANEQAVHAFHRGQISFPQIVGTIERVLERHDGTTTPRLEDVLEAERWARAAADAMLG